MNKELKMLLISILLVLIGVLTLITSQDNNCWDNYSTENDAIQACEGK